jgi:hypothetical protein
MPPEHTMALLCVNSVRREPKRSDSNLQKGLILCGFGRLVSYRVSIQIALITRGAYLRSSLYCPVRAARLKFVALSRR